MPKVPKQQPITTEQLLDEVHATVTKYVVLPSPEAATSVALWIAATHVLQAFQHAPRLAIKSPEKRCGKSRLLDVLDGLCYKPMLSANASVATIFRIIGSTEQPPTLLVDEFDTLFGTKRVAEQNEDLRGLLNAGHQRGRPAWRCVGPNQTPTEFKTFAMAALAGIGDMPDTITDRSVNITMRRRTVDEHVSTFRSRRDGPLLQALNDKLATWAVGVVDELATAEPTMPVEDRAADTWEPLIAVADLAGEQWAARARQACVVLSSAADDDDEESSLNTKLLNDIRDIFTETKISFLTSTELLAYLQTIEESPWGEWAMTPNGLARKLKHFGIRTARNTAGNARGYRLDHLEDAFRRYLRQNPSEASEPAESRGSSSDTFGASDTLTRQTETKCQTENGGTATNLTGLTLPDASTACVVQDCGTKLSAYLIEHGHKTCTNHDTAVRDFYDKRSA